ncbi:MAG TPA: cache domain-containing protein, partial [Anaerolineales bacterium]|nr:cache domain-containing protein [Anaerolineales bacterium]
MKRRYVFHRDLGLQLLALYLLLIIPFLVALWVFDGLIGVRIREDVQASDLSLAQSISQEVDLALTKALNAVEGLSAYPGVIEADNAAMEDVFSVFFNTAPDVNLVYRLDANGIMSYHYPVGPTSTVGDDFSFRDYFQRALITDRPLVSRGRISPTTNQAVATAVMPLWSEDGKFLGLIGANIRLESLSRALTNIIAEYPAQGGLQVIILDSSNQIIAHPDQEFLLQPANVIVPDDFLETFLAGEYSKIFEDLNG